MGQGEEDELDGAEEEHRKTRLCRSVLGICFFKLQGVVGFMDENMQLNMLSLSSEEYPSTLQAS